MVFFKKRVGTIETKKLVQKTATFVISAFGIYSNIQSSKLSAAKAAVGHGSDNTATNNNFYSSGSSRIGYVTYTFDASEIPQDAQNISVSCAVKGGRENASQGKTDVSVYVNSSQRGSTISYTTTASSVKTIDVGTVTRAELDTLYLQVDVAYYGGHIDGATLTVTYEVYE